MNDHRAGASPSADQDRSMQDKSKQAGTSAQASAGTGGEDDASTEIEGEDSHLHEDQKSSRLDTP